MRAFDMRLEIGKHKDHITLKKVAAHQYLPTGATYSVHDEYGEIELLDVPTFGLINVSFNCFGPVYSCLTIDHRPLLKFVTPREVTEDYHWNATVHYGTPIGFEIRLAAIG